MDIRRYPLLLACLLLTGNLFARSYTYTLTWDQPQEHFYQVELFVEGANENFLRLQVPAWRPGRYYLQDYGAGITDVKAKTPQGAPLPCQREDGHTWLVQNGTHRDVKVTYRFYANTHDAGSSVLNKQMAYFNPVNFFMHARDLYEVPCTLRVPQIRNWKAATALRKDPNNNGLFYAKDYHEMVDSPTILSPSLKTLHSRIDDVDYYFHFQGHFPNNKEVEDAVQSNLGKIIREQTAIFGGAPMEEYHFIYLLSDKKIRHAVEHANSAMFTLPDNVTISPVRIAGINGISAHEFFHLWNVKRLRPAAMWPYDYQKEQYTTLHWFTEGVTDYYASLTQVRAGLMSRTRFYEVLASNITGLENNPATWKVSPSESSFNSWLSRSAYHPPYSRVSYYSLGTRVGFLLDLKIRAETKGKVGMDDVFRSLYRVYYSNNKGMPEDGVKNIVEIVAETFFDDFFQNHIDGVQPIDYASFFSPVGLYLDIYTREDRPWYKIGVTRSSDSEAGLHLDGVIPGSDAAKAGLSVGDIIQSINGKPFAAFDSEDFFYAFSPGKYFTAEVMTGEGKVSTRVQWTGKLDAREYQLLPMPKVSKKQQKLLDGWLSSQVK